jgi:hypothetical protein
MLSTVSVRSVPLCLGAVHCQYSLHSIMPPCCPPSVSAQFLCTLVLSTISIHSVPSYLGARPSSAHSPCIPPRPRSSVGRIHGSTSSSVRHSTVAEQVRIETKMKGVSDAVNIGENWFQLISSFQRKEKWLGGRCRRVGCQHKEDEGFGGGCCLNDVFLRLA